MMDSGFNLSTVLINELIKSNFCPITGHEGTEGDYMYSSTLSLTSALEAVGGQRHVLAATLLGKRPNNHCIGDWVGPKAGLDGCGKFLHRDLIPEPSSP
jgi:hypothetical protein